MRISERQEFADPGLTRDSPPTEPNPAPSFRRVSHPIESGIAIRYSPFGQALLWGSQTLTVIIVCGLPWWFGAIQPAAKFAAAAAITVAVCLLFAATLLESPDKKLGTPLAMVGILIGALLLGAFQLVRLPSAILATVAPENASLWQELAPAFSSQDSAVAAGLDTGFWSADPRRSISLNPGATKHDLSLLTIAVGMFLLGSFQFSSDRAVFWLLVALATCGSAFAFFGIAQQLTWDGKIYGKILITNGSPFAAFVNRNNAGGYLNLSLAACLGLFLLSLRRGWLTDSLRPSSLLPPSSPPLPQGEVGPQGRVRISKSAADLSRTKSSNHRSARRSNFKFTFDPVREFIADITGVQLFAAVASILVFAAVLCTLSRGALLACVLSLAFVSLASGLLAKHRLLNAAGWLALAFAGLGLTAWVGRLDDIQQRAESLGNVISHPDGRWGHWRDALAGAVHFWPTGSGFGTHRFTYRLFESFPTEGWFLHAENQYVEAFVDGGFLGLGLMLASLALTFKASWSLIRNPSDRTDLIVGVVGLFAIFTQAIHACFDFGLYMPANACLLALICGLVHSRHARRNLLRQEFLVASRQRLADLQSWASGKAVRSSLAFSTVVILVMATISLRADARVEAAMLSVPVDQTGAGKIGSDPSVMHRMEFATQLDPEDPLAHLRAAEVWLDRYRQQAWKSLVAARPNAPAEQLWETTSPLEMHAWVRNLVKSNRTAELEDFRRSGAVQENLRPAVRHLLAARASCPLIPEVHLLLSELAPMISAQAELSDGIERVGRCAPVDGSLLAEAGFVALASSRPQIAAGLWRRASAVDFKLTRLPRLVRLAWTQESMRPHLSDLLPNDPVLLIKAARESFAGEEDREIRRLVTKHAKEILPATSMDQSHRLHLEGLVFLLEDQRSEAIDRLTKASQLNPMEVSWRFELATALADHGLTDQAREHASFCYRMDPNNEQYLTLLKRLIHTSLTSP